MINYKGIAASIAKNGIKKNDALKLLSLLQVSQTKTLLKDLRLANEKNSLYIITADEPTLKLKRELDKKFPDSNVRIIIDKNIGAGIRIRKFDTIYDSTIKSRIKNLVDELTEVI